MNTGIIGFPGRATLATEVPLSGGGPLAENPVVGLDPAFFASFMAGFVPSNSGADPSNDVDFTPGSCVDSAGKSFIASKATITRQLDAPFGVGSGGLSGSLTKANNTWYHAFAVLTSDGSASVGYDTSIAAANLVADHRIRARRRVGSILTDGAANILGFYAREVAGGALDVSWGAIKVDASGATIANANATLRPLTVPPDYRVRADLQVDLVTNGAVTGTFRHYFSSPDSTDEAPATAPYTTMRANGASGTIATCQQLLVWTNTVREIRHRAGGTTELLSIGTRGWFDPRVG